MTTGSPLRLGTRRSALAQWQADWVASQLTALGAEVQIVHMTTSGDAQSGPIGSSGGVGAFTKTIQEALLRGQVDLAVHSLKDLPTEPIDGLTLTAVPPRASTRDVLISRGEVPIEDLPSDAVIGTGSLRRRAQLLFLRPDVRVAEIRGNVDTRLRKLDEGRYDAVILAEAGLKRLGLESRITQVLSTEVMLPAIGQGALGVETRQEDDRTVSVVSRLDHAPSHSAVRAERAMLARLRGGCLAPIGGWGRVDEDQTLHLDGAVLSQDGRHRVAAFASGDMGDAETLGHTVADELLRQGADELITSSRGMSG